MKKSLQVVQILSCVASFAFLMPLSGRADCPTFTVGPSNLPDAIVGMSYLQPITNQTWTSTGSLNDLRTAPIANVLNDGRVFVCGGFFASWDYAKCEIYNPANSQWTETEQMVEGDTGRGGNFSATVLQSGKVLVFGGDETLGTDFATEIYDPQTDSWTTYATPAGAVRSAHTATLLDSGKVLVTGGLDSTDSYWLTNAWLFDPTTTTWTQTGKMHSPRAFHHATLLLSGKVLITDDTGTAELYDPATGTFSVTDAPAESSGKCVTLLPNGNVLACSGANDGTDAEIYDPATKAWRPTGSLHSSRWNATSTLLQNGQVLVAGGTAELGAPIATCEIYDPQTEVWTVVQSPTLNTVTLATLNDGTVLGFGDGTTDARLFGAVAVQAVGNTAPVTYQLTDGSLPRGLALTPAGVLVGTPFQLGTFTFTITATDTAGCTGTGTVLMTVKSAAAITFDNLTQYYDGNPKSVSVMTEPPGLNVTVFYNGSNTPPSEAGSYQIMAIVNDAAYAGSATAKFSINCGPDLAHAVPLPAVNFGSNFVMEISRLFESTPTTVQRQDHTATKLLDGRIMAVGGYHWYISNNISIQDGLRSTETYDPDTGVWTAAAPLLGTRCDHCAALLNDGRLLVAGGRTDPGYIWWLQTAEIYDPVTNGWNAVLPMMGYAHPGGTATTLPNGTVLICGGGTAEIFDPTTVRWTSGSTMNTIHTAQTATLLPNGKVLVTGGGSAEIYDPSSNKWVPTSPMNSTSAGTATLLPNGTVLVVAGAVTEAYDPNTDVWTTLSGEPHPRTSAPAMWGDGPRAAHTATLLPDGRVLIEGSFQYGDPIELYDPATDTWTTSDREVSARYCSIAHLLPCGAVLFVGGGTFQQENYPCSIYVPFFDGVPPFNIWGALPNGLTVDSNLGTGLSPTLSGIPQAVGTTILPLTATDWNGQQLCLTFKLVVLPSRSSSDTTAPTVAITNPGSDGATVSNPFITISGTAADTGGSVNTGVALVLYSLNGGPQQIASTTSHFANWSAGVLLNTGANTFTVQSFDYRGNASAPVTHTINYQWYSPLTVLTRGLGSVSIRSGTQLKGDQTYWIKATPGKQQMFSNWVDNASGLTLTPSTQCTFVMKRNLTLVANFVPNPIAVNKLNGTYNGLFFETTGIAEKSAGAIFNLAVKIDRTYSAKLYLAGANYRLTGTFDLSGNDSQTITRSGPNAVNVSLHIDWDTGSKQITGVVSCAGENWRAPLVTDLAGFGAGNPFPTHRYTMALAPATDAPANSPSGYGYGLINIPANGVMKLAGKLADGTSFSQTVPLSKDSSAPVYCDLYNHRGLIVGWLSFASGRPTGSLSWIAPANTVPGYPAGLNTTNGVIGSIYAPQSPALNLPTATLNISDGFGGEAPLQFKAMVNNNNSITEDSSPEAAGFNSTNAVSGNIQTSTGLISLKYRPTGATQNRTAFGVALPDSNCAYGAFATPSANGSISLH